MKKWFVRFYDHPQAGMFLGVVQVQRGRQQIQGWIRFVLGILKNPVRAIGKW